MDNTKIVENQNTKAVSYVNNSDEIDLYDLLNMILKNKTTVMITFIGVSILSLVLALYVRATTEDKQGVNFIVRNEIYSDYFFKKANINITRVELDQLLNNDSAVNEILSIPKLKEQYKKDVKVRNESNGRKYLTEILTLKLNKKILKENNLDVERVVGGKLEISIKGDKELEREIAEKFFSIYSNQSIQNVENLVTQKKVSVEKEKADAEITIKGLENALNIASANINTANIDPENLDKVLEFKNPRLATDLKEAKANYAKFSEELNGITGFIKESKYDELIEKTSSYYTVEVESKAKIILAVGMVLGLFLGIFMAFMKEFWNGYKKKYGN